MSDANSSKDSEDSKTKETVYRMRGFSLNAYIDETGEFRWILPSNACNDEDSINRTLAVLRKMPSDRRAVWVPRLDRDETIARCPLIQNKPELSKALDELLAAHDKARFKTSQEKDGGENANEQTKSEK